MIFKDNPHIRAMLSDTMKTVVLAYEQLGLTTEGYELWSQLGKTISAFHKAGIDCNDEPTP